MAYTVLARKYRSWTFDQLIGQEAVTTTLKNAVTSGRIHHGYLFCGTRGVGKTSAARVLARSLNCLASDQPTIEPCLKCDSCLAIAEGQDVDVIEIDAASNTGVDNIREVRSNTMYRPARSRYKIYIIDEVHMLSTGAFNALLKTLEEPPEHVKFIMATTEPQKVPATIQSRCQQFDFHTISAEKIAEHVEWILQQEKITAEPGVVRRIARMATGSMRDALSLMDQLLAIGGDRLTLQTVEDLLPAPQDETLMQMLGQLADHDPAGALGTAETCLSAGYSLERLAESLAEQTRSLMLLRVCGQDTPLLDWSESARTAAMPLAARFEPDDFVYIITVLEELRRRVRLSTLGRALFEAALVRLAATVRYQSLQTLLDQLAADGGGDPADLAQNREKTTGQGRSTGRASSARSGGPEPSASPRNQPRTAGRRTSARSNTPSRQARNTSPPQQASAGPRRGVSLEDQQKARSQPAVREALGLLGGQIVNVEHTPPPASDPNDVGAANDP